MNVWITRQKKDGTVKAYEGNLFLSNGNFTLDFHEKTDGIGLGDGKFHNITKLKGVAHNVIIDGAGIALEGCFVNIGNKWHQDGLSLYLNKPLWVD